MEKLTDKLKNRITRTCAIFVALPLGLFVLMTILSANMIYNTFWGPFPMTAKELSAIKNVITFNKYYVDIKGDKAYSTPYAVAKTRDRENIKQEDVVSHIVLLHVPPRILLVNTLHGEIGNRYIGKLGVLPSDLLSLLRKDPDFTPNTEKALLPMILNVTEGMTGEFAIYEMASFILLVIAIFNGGRLLWWSNFERHPLGRRLARYGSLPSTMGQVNQEAATAAEFGTAVLTDSWIFFPKLGDVVVLRTNDVVWAYEVSSENPQKPGGITLCTRDGKSVLLPFAIQNAGPFLQELSQRARWIIIGFDPKVLMNWKTNRQSVIDESDRLRTMK